MCALGFLVWGWFFGWVSNFYLPLFQAPFLCLF
uniref:Uncharacterized protein n=1 Tax=Trichinella nativa TaxID=6335 RepID=A0A0V1KIF1_9BILA